MDQHNHRKNTVEKIDKADDTAQRKLDAAIARLARSHNISRGRLRITVVIIGAIGAYLALSAYLHG